MTKQGDEGGSFNFLGQSLQFFWHGTGAKSFLWLLFIGGLLLLIAMNLVGPATPLGQSLGKILGYIVLGVVVYLCIYGIFKPSFFYDSQTWLKHEQMSLGDKQKGVVAIEGEVISTQPIIQGQVETEGKSHEDRKEIKG